MKGMKKTEYIILKIIWSKVINLIIKKIYLKQLKQLKTLFPIY